MNLLLIAIIGLLTVAMVVAWACVFVALRRVKRP
jgi:hypothetical protein